MKSYLTVKTIFIYEHDVAAAVTLYDIIPFAFIDTFENTEVS